MIIEIPKDLQSIVLNHPPRIVTTVGIIHISHLSLASIRGIMRTLNDHYLDILVSGVVDYGFLSALTFPLPEVTTDSGPILVTDIENLSIKLTVRS